MKIAIIACDVFQDEIEALVARNPSPPPIVWLEMGLHDHPNTLREKIQEQVAVLDRNSDLSAIVLAYGLCGNGLAGIRAGRHSLVIPRAHDCISILLGGPGPHAAVLKENPGTYFYSPGWIRGRRVPGPDRESYLREIYGDRHPEDPELVDDLVEADQETFSHHNCAAYVDLDGNAQAEGYCRKCASHLGWSFKRLSGDPALLRDLVSGPWDPDRFVRVPPGGRLVLAPDGTLAAG